MSAGHISSDVLLSAAAPACADAGLAGREQALAYCLAVLAAKRDPRRVSPDGHEGRQHGLGPNASDAEAKLADRAADIARNLRVWGPAYEAVQTEWFDYRVDTLRSLIRAGRHDDVADVVALKLGEILGHAPALDEMALEEVAGAPPNAYVFQTPLAAWAMTTFRRAAPRDDDPLDDHAERGSSPFADPAGDEPEASDDVIVEDLMRAREIGEELLTAYMEASAELGRTRGPLAEAIARADLLEAGLSRLDSIIGPAPSLVTRIRAGLVHEADSLRQEQEALDPMLAYVALGLAGASRVQRVAVLSLRLERIDRAAAEHIASRLRSIPEEPRHPTRRLRMRTEEAVERAARAVAGTRRQAAVPGTRARALTAVAERPEQRRSTAERVTRMLDELPPTIADDRAIATFEDTQVTNVTTARNDAATELRHVEPILARVFHRYAGGRG